MAKTSSWWKLMKAQKRCRLRAAGDYLLHSLLVGRLIGMKFIHQSESCLLFLSWIFLGGETFDLLSSVAHVFQETCICHDHLQPTKEVVFWFPVQQLHQEDLNLPTFVKIGEPTDEDFFYNWEDGCEHNGDKW